MDDAIASDTAIAREWDGNAESWAAAVRSGRDLYREHFNSPAFLHFIGDVEGKMLLDAGCGEGYNTRILARAGARVTGVAISERMITRAQEEERRVPLGIHYQAASFTELSVFGVDSFDAVVSFMALMDGADLDTVVREIARVLRPGGELFFSVLHPCFVTQGFGWLYDEAGREVALRVGGYFDTRPYIDHWHFEGMIEHPDFSVPRFPRTLSQYVNAVTTSGLRLQQIEEPRPTEAACERFPWLERWREHAALFLYIRASKDRT
ncbi:MAG TPA: class I SAM-dependent methyltransferase [Chloroflexota bacterium]